MPADQGVVAFVSMPRSQRQANSRLAGSALGLAALVLGLFGLRGVITSRRFQFFGGMVRRVEVRAPVVALTFDDAPSSFFFTEIRDTLRARSARGTFFVVGALAERDPSMLRDLVADGHELGNHSWSHHRMVLKSAATIRSELERCDALIREAGQKGPIHFRPPYCAKLIGLPRYLSRTGRRTILWDVEPDSISGGEPSPDEIVRRTLARTRAGSIILLHPMGKGNPNARAALPAIIDGLREHGFRLVTVSELLAHAAAEAGDA